jgi:hypothetical protein
MIVLTGAAYLCTPITYVSAAVKAIKAITFSLRLCGWGIAEAAHPL